METIQIQFLGKIQIRNPENVAAYRRDIEEAVGRSLPNDEGNYTMVGRFFGSDLDHLEHLGLLNRGYCPFCGASPIDRTYTRGSNFSKVKVFLCKDCWEQTNPNVQLNRSIATLDLKNPNHRRALPYFLMALLFRNFKWFVLIVIGLIAWVWLQK